MWYHAGMKKVQKARTIRLDEKDEAAIAALKDHYGINSDNDVIRFVLREMHRQIQGEKASEKPKE